jgi:H+-translocating NAD(P) transhydrogenase subunit beta
MEFIRDYADWFYLIGAVLFILTLRGFFVIEQIVV